MFDIDIYVLFAIALIGALTVSIFLYVMYKKLLSFLEHMAKKPLSALMTDENIELVSEKLINNQKFQRFLFEAGALVGNGAKSGFGAFGGGKKGNLSSMLMGLAGEWLQNKVPGGIIPKQQVQDQTQNSNTSMGVQ